MAYPDMLFIRHSSTVAFRGLPFKLDARKAASVIEQNFKYLEIPPNNVRKDIFECYLPFHASTIHGVSGQYKCSYGIDRVKTFKVLELNIHTKVTEWRTKTRIQTEWIDHEGELTDIDYDRNKSHMQMYADFVFPNKYCKILRKPIGDVRELTINEISSGKSRIKFYPHQMAQSMSMEKTINSINKLERDRLITYIKSKFNADHVRINSFDVELSRSKIKSESFHMPAFIYKYAINGTPMYKIVDGYNGACAGDVAYSPTKSVALSIATTTVVAAGVLLATQTIRAPSILFSGLVIIAVAIPVYFWSGMRHVWFAQKYQMKTNSSHAHNGRFQYTIQDHIRINMVDKFNASDVNWNIVDEENYRFNSDEVSADMLSDYEVLGVSEIGLTCQGLKTAYRKQLMIWHPDHCDIKDKVKANDMTVRINAAFDNLLKKVDNKSR
jgi:hypothetical protein